MKKIPDLDALRTAVLELISQTSRTLRIVTADLEYSLYSQADVLSALSAFARRDRHTHIEVLVHDTQTAVKRDHGLIKLHQRLSSYIAIRTTHVDHQGLDEAWLIADRQLMLLRESDRHEGQSISASHVVSAKVDEFIRMWDKSLPDTRLRRLYI